MRPEQAQPVTAAVGREEAHRAPAQNSGDAVHSTWFSFLAIGVLASVLFGLRLAAPPNLLDQDQERPAAYVLDAVNNHHWICQQDLFGDLTSKPPLYTWLCAGLTLVFGRINLFALYLPGALAALGTAWLILAAARPHFGTRAAWFGVLASMLTTASLKEFGLARTDGVFAFTVTAAALLAFNAWSRGRGWTWFWLLAALATLTKGPLGVVLAAGGLLAVIPERKASEPLPLRGRHLPGLGLFFLLTVGWFALAYAQFGQSLVAKMLGRELLGHTTGATGHFPGTLFYRPPLYYLGRAAPWSLLACYGLWRMWRHPDPRATTRRFERFLFCWFMLGLVIFSLAPHQRADLLWPLMPAGAMLAGRELSRLTASVPGRILVPLTALAVLLAVVGFGFYYFGPHARHPAVRETVALRKLAAELERRGGRGLPLTHVDDPMAFQVYLNTLRPLVSAERAAQLLRAPEAAFVALRKVKNLEAALRPEDPPLYTILTALEPGGSEAIRIVGNRPVLSATEPFGMAFGPLTVRARGVRLIAATEPEFRFVVLESSAGVAFTNESPAPRRIRVHLSSAEHRVVRERLLAPSETWSPDMNLE